MINWWTATVRRIPGIAHVRLDVSRECVKVSPLRSLSVATPCRLSLCLPATSCDQLFVSIASSYELPRFQLSLCALFRVLFGPLAARLRRAMHLPFRASDRAA